MFLHITFYQNKYFKGIILEGKRQPTGFTCNVVFSHKHCFTDNTVELSNVDSSNLHLRLHFQKVEHSEHYIQFTKQNKYIYDKLSEA